VEDGRRWSRRVCSDTLKQLISQSTGNFESGLSDEEL